MYICIIYGARLWQVRHLSGIRLWNSSSAGCSSSRSNSSSEFVGHLFLHLNSSRRSLLFRELVHGARLQRSSCLKGVIHLRAIRLQAARVTRVFIFGFKCCTHHATAMHIYIYIYIYMYTYATPPAPPVVPPFCWI